MDIVLASRNGKKIREMETILSHFASNIKVLSLDDIGVIGDIDENGNSFEENALIKARVPAALGYIGIADDSGLCVNELGGAPGIFSARWSGGDTDENNAKLMSLLDGVAAEKRGAKFVSVICAAFPDGRTVSARGEVNGFILNAPMGEHGFGYDPLFWYEAFGKSFAQMSDDEKNSISHRGRAMEKFIPLLIKQLKK